jgi:hypothetical protein
MLGLVTVHPISFVILSLQGQSTSWVRPEALVHVDTNPIDTVRAKASLAAICPGRVVSERGTLGCSVCPDGTSFSPGFGQKIIWSPVAIAVGHFLKSESTDAIVSMKGCEGHSENFGGTALLTSVGNGWTKLWYQPGLITERCTRVRTRSGRDILLC